MQNFPSNGQSAARCDIIVGTRPEAIKLAPVIKALRESGDDFKVRVVTSGQHGEICRSALAAFGLTADSELDIEPITGSLADAAGICCGHSAVVLQTPGLTSFSSRATRPRQ